MPRRHRRRAKPEWEGREIITVAALPGRGLYVRHIGHPEGVDGVHRPTVRPPGAPPRPPAAFDERWLAAAVPEVDVVHVHGLPQRISPDAVERAVAVVRDSGTPLVVTAYHLSDPAGGGEERYAEQLDPLVRQADAVVTLTAAAAARLQARFGVEAIVLPHPHAVDFVRLRRPRPTRAGRPFTIGAHLGSLRMPLDPVRFARGLADAVREVPDARLVVHVHDHLVDPGSASYAPEAIAGIRRAVEAGGGTVRAHRPMTDPQLWDHLFALDASVVPPLHGSHSIWPEACFDLGTHVLIPQESLAAAQHPSLTYDATADGIDTASLATALLAARSSSAWRADPSERWAERMEISESLRKLYERFLPAKAHPLPPAPRAEQEDDSRVT